ncbi:nitroreductase family protein [Myxococcota bacterium]|nr:nitroreductase family protein [Myxococcota bacterium]
MSESKTHMIGLLEGIASTRAIRRFTDEPVSDEDLAQILFLATRAPSGSNRQPWRFIVLRDDERSLQAKQLLGEMARRMWEFKRRGDRYDEGSGQRKDSPKSRLARSMDHFAAHFEEAPVVILPCFLPYRESNPMDGASIYPCCQNLLLAARGLGLGGVMTGFQAGVDQELKALLGIPESVVLSACIPLGHPQGSHGPVRRRPLSEFVFEGGWDQTPTWAVDPTGTRHTRAGPPGHRTVIDPK